nr:zinc finger, CCHC-type [Tanacetum cinerariifolium]
MTTSFGNNSENYLEHPIPEAPVAPPRQQVPPAAAAAHGAWVKGQKEVDVLMLLTMDLDIQRNLAHLGAYDMLQELKAIFSKQAEQKLLQTVREFHACKQEEGQSVSSYVLKMKGNIDNLERLGQPVGQNLVKNKPHKAAKGGYGKGKNKMGYAPNNVPFSPKPKIPPPPKKDYPAKDAICHQCGKVGYWRRNCLVYLAELMKKKKLSQGASNLGLQGSKKLKPGALSLYADDGHHATCHLELSSGLVIVLNNCHYAPSITRGVILVSRLFDDGFINRFDENNVISVSKNNLVYFMAIPRDGIFEIDMSYSNTNDSSMYVISNKRAKINLDSSLLWHCRLGHVSKKRIEKLQHDRLLNSIDIESLGKYVSFMSRKMVFQKEVENQLGKTIKSLRSDRIGEYTSQEFLDHLKEHGIIAHRTSPYTPQNNEDTNPSLDTSLDHEEDDQEIDEPQSDINPIRNSSRTRRAPDRMCLHIDAEEHEFGDLGEPANYKVALLDPESKKWLDAIDVEMRSMKDNDVWVLVELPPNARTISSK